MTWDLLIRMILAGVRAAPTAGIPVSSVGRIEFVGLINHRPLGTVTQQEIRNAFAKIGLREAHNSHFISRLVLRGPQFGIHTLDAFARAVNQGIARAGTQAGTIEIVLPSARAALVVNALGELITFLPL
jgi:hypothetical protein